MRFCSGSLKMPGIEVMHFSSTLSYLGIQKAYYILSNGKLINYFKNKN